MNDDILKTEIEILKLFKPIAISARDSVDQIAYLLRKVSELNRISSNVELNAYKQKVYRHLQYISEISSTYELYKKQLIEDLEKENFIDFQLSKDEKLEMDTRANVFFITGNGDKRDLY